MKFMMFFFVGVTIFFLKKIDIDFFQKIMLKKTINYLYCLYMLI